VVVMSPTSTRRLAMFPLSMVAFPGSVIPLHIFEPRYQQLTTDCLAGDARFGIVLIERGSEVGGGDQRAPIGTEVHITKAMPLSDGRWLVMATAERRIRLVEWLDDDPYPLAMVEEWTSDADEVDPLLVTRATQGVRRTRALLSEQGETPALPADATFDDDPAAACWELCAEAPLNAYDAQRLLAIDSTTARLELLLEITAELEVDLHRMLAE
jgi:Lon protease-like protein